SNVQSGPSLSRLLSLIGSSKIVVIAHLCFANRPARCEQPVSVISRLIPKKENPKNGANTSMIAHCHLSDRGTQLNYSAQNHLKKSAKAFDERLSA
ncbi:MAG: hypothetical protein E6559_04800, partial [Pantoea sp.]|nr:hypothetical protein [Pantoea sp.]